MERAGRLLRALKLPEGCADFESLARAAWPAAVGKRLASRTRAVGYEDGCLTVEVNDPVWLPHLQTMYSQIIGRLQEIAGKDVVRRVRLKQGIPRIEPKRAGQTEGNDEADGIKDPGLRRVYLRSRKRSLA